MLIEEQIINYLLIQFALCYFYSPSFLFSSQFLVFFRQCDTFRERDLQQVRLALYWPVLVCKPKPESQNQGHLHREIEVTEALLRRQIPVLQIQVCQICLSFDSESCCFDALISEHHIRIPHQVFIKNSKCTYLQYFYCQQRIRLRSKEFGCQAIISYFINPRIISAKTFEKYFRISIFVDQENMYLNFFSSIYNIILFHNEQQLISSSDHTLRNMKNTKISLDTTANLSFNMTQPGSPAPFNSRNPNAINDAENTLTNSFYQQTRRRINPAVHNRTASYVRDKINQIIFDVQESAFLKKQGVEYVQQTNQFLVQNICNRRAPVFGGQKSLNYNIRQSIENGFSNFGSVYKHSPVGSDIPLSVLMDQTSFQQSNNIVQNNVGVSYFDQGTQENAKYSVNVKKAINEEIRRNHLLNQKFYFLERQNEQLKARNLASTKLQKENQELRRTIKSFSVSDVSRITTSKLINQVYGLKEDTQCLREQTLDLIQKTVARC